MFEELVTAARFRQVHTWGRFLWGEAGATSSLYEHDGDVAHFDLEGRWQRAKVNGRTLLRGLDGVVLERFGGAGGEDVRLTDVRLAHEAVTSLLERARLEAPLPLPGWTVEQLLGERARFLEAYRPVGIVPPDRYRSLIIQATQGCAYNGCLFCSLYKGQRHRVVPPDELRAHVRAVKTFVGSGLEARRGLFLGEANALAMPQAALLEVFDILHAELPTLAVDVSSFIDAFDDYRTAAELAALRARGLTRVFIGVESGDEPTLAALGKPATVAGVSRLVQSLKAGGVSVGVIFLAGLGRAHVEKSAELLPTLGLDEHDVVYVSPLVIEGRQPSGEKARSVHPERSQGDDRVDSRPSTLLAGLAEIAIEPRTVHPERSRGATFGTVGRPSLDSARDERVAGLGMSGLALQLARRGIASVDAEAEATELRARLKGRAKVARYDVRRWVYT